MKLDNAIQSVLLPTGARQTPLGPYIDGFVAGLEALRYARDSVQQIVYGAVKFAVFLRRRGVLDLRALQPSHVEAFLATQPMRCNQGKYYYRASMSVCGARHVVRYGRALGVIPPEPAPPPPVYAPVLDEWLGFLKDHKGLSPRTIELYRGHVAGILQSLGSDASPAKLRCLGPDRVRDEVCRATKGFSRSQCRNIVSAMAGFLRFAWDRGYLSRDLAGAVGRVRSFKHDRLPRGPRWQDAQRLLTTTSCTTAVGQRDHAILQVLLAYGVRAKQVCELRLEDIAWRESTIRFAALKGGRPVEVPLLRAVGEAILAYLQRSRPPSSDRHVFLNSWPPFRPLVSGTISNLVRRAFGRAGVSSPHRGSHALRHAWATHMLAEGRSLKTIADLLGHRSLETTRIYAKVDFERLRSVGLPWPEERQA